jgi:hypothetical protein
MGLLPIVITTLLTVAAIGVGVFSAALLLVQQQASATTTTITHTASHNNKCSGSDIVTCTDNKKTVQHSTNGDSTTLSICLYLFHKKKALD